MKALLVKDLLVMKRTLSPLFLFPLAIIVLCGSGSTPFLIAALASILPLFFAFLAYGTFYHDETSGWERRAHGLPVTARTRVVEKYVLSGLLLALGGAVSCCASVTASIAFGIDTGFALLMVWAGLLVGVLYIAVLIPAVLAFGVQKGPAVFIGCIALLVAAPAIATSAGVQVDMAGAFASVPLLVGATGAAALAAIGVSVAVSIACKR